MEREKGEKMSGWQRIEVIWSEAGKVKGGKVDENVTIQENITAPRHGHDTLK